jgi:hypothetical protein
MKPEKSGPIRNVTSVVKGTPLTARASSRRRQSTWYLDCGHVLFRKASVPVPERAHCPECGLKAVPEGTNGEQVQE